MKAISSVTGEQSRRSRVSSPNPMETIASRSLALMISLTWLTGHQYTCSQSFQQIPQSPWDDGSKPLPTLFLFTGCCLSLCAVLFKKVQRVPLNFSSNVRHCSHICVALSLNISMCLVPQWLQMYTVATLRRCQYILFIYSFINNKVLNA